MKLDNKYHRFGVNFILLFVASYFVVRKTTLFSGSALITDIFQPAAGEMIVDSLTYIVLYALIARLSFFCIDHFKKRDIPNLCFPHYRCLLNNNKEIEKHLKELKEGKLALGKIQDEHSYDENVQIIHRNFSEHLLLALKEKKVGARDVFLSLFHDKSLDFEYENISVFSYSSHYDPTLHDTSTSEIEPSKKKYRGFAGSRAIKTGKPVICHEIDSKTYEVGHEERRKSIKHYFGIPLKIDTSVVGLLNIEFHNTSIFSSSDEMKSFYQKEVQAFTYLYEYQMHKKYFFEHLNEKVVTP